MCSPASVDWIVVSEKDFPPFQAGQNYIKYVYVLKNTGTRVLSFISLWKVSFVTYFEKLETNIMTIILHLSLISLSELEMIFQYELPCDP